MFSILKSALLKVGVGLLYGVGIGISAGYVLYVISENMTSSIWNDEALDSVVVLEHEEVRRDGAVLFLGTIENRGSEKVRSASVEIDLFDEEGKFVEQCSQYFRGALRAMEQRHFKVSCGGCEDRQVVEHASYKVRVRGL